MNEFTRIAKDEDLHAGFTVRDFERLMAIGAFEDMRVELVEGVLEKMMPTHMAHGECHGYVSAELHLAYRGTAYRLANDLAVEIGVRTVRAADVAVAGATAPRHGIVPARDLLLAVEIADTSVERDLGPKRREYAECGIPHYWVVEVNARIAHLMSDPDDGDYRTEAVARFGEPIPVPGTDRTITID
jgi:Uma2 family endonuclease